MKIQNRDDQRIVITINVDHFHKRSLFVVDE